MENCRIFKLEFYNLIIKENAINYHETDQKSWFLLTEGYMCSSLWRWWGYMKKCENRGYINKIEKIPMVTSNFSTIYFYMQNVIVPREYTLSHILK